MLKKTIVNNPWVKPYLFINKKLLLLTVLLGVLTAIAASALMFTSGYLISKSATRPENILLVYVPIVLVRTFGIARPVFKYLERLTSHNFVLKIVSSMRVRLFQQLERQAVSLKSTYAIGDLLGVLAEDLEHLQDLYLRTIFPTVVGIVLYGIVVMALGFFSIPFMLLVLLLLFIIAVLLPIFSLQYYQKRLEQLKKQRHALYKKLTDAVMGLSDWKISGRQQHFLNAYEEQEKAVDELGAKMERFSHWRAIIFQVIVGLLVICMLVFASFQVEIGVFHPIWIAAFVLVVFPLTEVLMPMSDALSHMPGYNNSLQRLNQLESTAEIVSSEKGELVSELKKERSYRLRMEHVQYRYDIEDSKNVLEDINVTFEQGERVAILGKSGSGKSTMAKLFVGAMQPTAGLVTMNGIEMAQLADEVSTFISVMQQKPHLFDTTVMNNIRLGNPKATDEEIIEVAKQVGMHDYIISLPEGYHTRMQELGERFSGGERQRIALARILLQNAPIVILDEPTISLDAITERKLLSTLFSCLEGKTIIWITHHLSGVDDVDRVLFLEKGQILLDGTHEQLLQTNERYAKLYQLDRPF